jgi:nitroreductase
MHSIDKQTILKIVGLALRAPSGDNCQPWTFSWNGTVLCVFHDEDRGKHALNPSNVSSLLTLGCLVETIALAASEHHLQTSIEPLAADLPSFADGGDHRPWAQIRFSEGATADPLAAGISIRRTDRSRYHNQPLSQDQKNALNDLTASQPGVALRFCDPQATGLAPAIAALDALIWEKKPVQQDLMAWIRYGRPNAVDGMHWRTLGIDWFQSCILWLCRQWRWQQFFNCFGFKSMSIAVLKKQIQSSGNLYLLTTADDQPESFIRCGRAAVRIWIQLNLWGWGVQPLTLGSLVPFLRRVGGLPAVLGTGYESRIQKCGNALDREFRLAPNQLPLWMFRTGIGQSRIAIRTGRLPAEQVVHFVQDNST